MYFILHPISSLNHLAARLVTDQLTFFSSIIFFIILALNYKKPFFQALDYAVSNWACESRSSFFKNRAESLAIFGNALFHILLSVVLCFICLIVKHKFSLVLSIFFVLIFSWGLNRFMKLVYKRERPLRTPHSELRTQTRLSYCFPSGHVMASIPIYFFCAMLLQGLMPFLPWYLVALFLSISVIMSRIYLNHHYFTDVLGGVFMGIFCLNISIWFYFFMGLV